MRIVHHQRAAARAGGPAKRRERHAGPTLLDRLLQAGRGGQELGGFEVATHTVDQHALEATDHALGAHAGACQRRRAGHQARFIVHAHDRRGCARAAATHVGRRAGTPGTAVAPPGARTAASAPRWRTVGASAAATVTPLAAGRFLGRLGCGVLVGLGLRGRTAGTAARHALDQGVEVDLLHDTTGHEEFVGRLVGFQHFLGQHRRQRFLHHLPALAGHLHVQPLVHQDARRHVGQQHIAAGQFLALFQVLDAQPQFIEFGGRQVQHPHRQTRGHDLVVDGPFGQQFQATGSAQGVATGRAEARQQGALQRLAAVVEPGGLVLLERHPGVTPLLHLARRSGLVQRGGQAGFTGLDQLGKRTPHVNHKEFARLLGQGGNVLIGRGHNKFSMTRKDSISGSDNVTKPGLFGRSRSHHRA